MSDASREQLEAQIELLWAENAVQVQEIERLTRMIAELEARINQSSKNWSRPPSSDSPADQAEATKTRAERRAEAKEQRKDEVARRRGKQPGAAGKNLAVVSCPDVVVEHEATTCASCGEDLAAALVEGIERRQVFDTLEPVLICTEHRAFSKRCSCGMLTKATFPKEATAPTSYGPNVRAAALYLLFGQHLSVERVADAMSTMLGAEVSTGFVASLAKEAAGGLVGFMNVVRARLSAAPLVHVDETSDQVRREKWWFHVVSDVLYTYLFASTTRGKAAPDEAGVLPEYRGVMVHDRLAMYFKYDQADHAICGSHLLHDLAAVGVGWSQGWAIDMAALLAEMNDAAHTARAGGRTSLSKRVLADFLTRYDAIVEAGLLANPAPVGRRARLPRAQVVQLGQRPRDAQGRGHPLRSRSAYTDDQQRSGALVAHGQAAPQDQRLLPKRRRCPSLRHNPLLPLDGTKARRRRTRCPGSTVPRPGVDAAADYLRRSGVAALRRLRCTRLWHTRTRETIRRWSLVPSCHRLGTSRRPGQVGG